MAFTASAPAFVAKAGKGAVTRTAPLFNARVDSAAAVKKAMEATEKFGKDSKEARLAWEDVEEMDSSDNSAAYEKPLDEECSTADEAEACQDYEEKMAALSQILSEQKEKISTVKSLVGELKAIKLSPPEPSNKGSAPDSDAVQNALKAAKEAVAEYGEDSKEAKLAWEDLEEISASDNSAVMAPSLDEECLVEALEACEALEELSRAISA